MTKQEEFEKYCIDKERSKTKHDRYLQFEHSLRYCLCELKDKTDREDSFLLDDIKQSVLVFVMHNEYGENNEIFLSNMQNDFYNAIEKLVARHSDLDGKLKYVKLFMEDFYFNK